MNETLLFLLLGLGTGATIAAIAVGIVITYRGSGFINLAAGAMAMLAGFSFWALRTGELGFTLATPLAILLTYLFMVVVAIAIELAVFRPLRTAPPLAKLVASLGVLLTAQAAMLLAFGTTQHPQPTLIPLRVIRLLDGAVPLYGFVLSAAVVAITVLLWALYRWTRFGLATRAASENDVAARLAGLSPDELSLTNSILASLLLAHARHLRGLGRLARHHDTAVPRRAGARRGPLRQAHVLLDRVRVRPRHRDARVADRARVDEVVVPDQCRGGLARGQGAARLRAHRGGDVPARRVTPHPR